MCGRDPSVSSITKVPLLALYTLWITVTNTSSNARHLGEGCGIVVRLRKEECCGAQRRGSKYSGLVTKHKRRDKTTITISNIRIIAIKENHCLLKRDVEYPL